MTKTTIEWCDETWNPTIGCSRVSRGCEHCFAERVAHRGMSAEHRGLTVVGKHGPRWTGEVRFLPERLVTPLSWSKPRRVFVNSMSDLFHEALAFEAIAAIFGVMYASPQHTFQILTKRPERARDFFAWVAERRGKRWREATGECPTDECLNWARDTFPTLPNVWLGVSVEDQASADERIPELLACPAAVRWVSYEPALGPVDFSRFMWPTHARWPAGFKSPEEARAAGAEVVMHRQALVSAYSVFLDWIVVGGESGPGARPFDLAWARSVIAQGREAGVPVFVKQLGSHLVADCMRCRGDGIDPMRVDGSDPEWCVECGGAAQSGIEPHRVRLDDRKGGDMAEWPPYMRVREWPRGAR